MIIIHITDLDYKFSLIYYIHTLTFAHKIKQYTLQVCIYIYISIRFWTTACPFLPAAGSLSEFCNIERCKAARVTWCLTEFSSTFVCVQTRRHAWQKDVRYLRYWCRNIINIDPISN